jgi:hypothetical protein
MTFLRIVAAGLLLYVAAAQETATEEPDPHRLPCITTQCRKIQAFLKHHYCGESPFGEGSDDSCDLRDQKPPSAAVKIVAAPDCPWNEEKEKPECRQIGEVSSAFRDLLLREMHRIGLPPERDKETYFTVWQAASLTLLGADHGHLVGEHVVRCQLFAVIDSSGRMRVLRQLPCTKTDRYVPETTDWTPLDVVDVDGDGRAEIVLEADAYENHWIEVV